MCYLLYIIISVFSGLTYLSLMRNPKEELMLYLESSISCSSTEHSLSWIQLSPAYGNPGHNDYTGNSRSKTKFSHLIKFTHNGRTNLIHPALLHHRFDPFFVQHAHAIYTHNFSISLSLHSDLSVVLVFEYVVSQGDITSE